MCIRTTSGVSIERHRIKPGEEQAFADFIRMKHPQGALVSSGLLALREEGAFYFGDEDAPPQLGRGFEYCDLGAKSRHVLWLIRTNEEGGQHVAGILEWRRINPIETVITGIYVGRQFRRLGVATALMNEAICQMKSGEYSATLAFVNPNDQPTRDFLDNRGFQLQHSALGEDELRIRSLRSFEVASLFQP